MRPYLTTHGILSRPNGDHRPPLQVVSFSLCLHAKPNQGRIPVSHFQFDTSIFQGFVGTMAVFDFPVNRKFLTIDRRMPDFVVAFSIANKMTAIVRQNIFDLPCVGNLY